MNRSLYTAAIDTHQHNSSRPEGLEDIQHCIHSQMIRDCSSNFVHSLRYSSHIRQYLKRFKHNSYFYICRTIQNGLGMNCERRNVHRLSGTDSATVSYSMAFTNKLCSTI